MSRTIEFFKEISKIPRESGNEKQISDYICEFAKKRNLEYIQDEYNNVIIKKYVNDSEPIILQAHLDMVCEKESDLQFDFEKDSIKIIEENGFFKAQGTTLGADNGIGVAQILNLLDSDLDVSIEAVFTVTEETTMIGSEKIDVSTLKGKKLINLDGFEEKTIINESAAFVDIIIETNYECTNVVEENIYKVILNGMEGGHSGADIDKDRGNATIELSKMLRNIKRIQIASFIGGTKFNVIPVQAECTFITDVDFGELLKLVKNFNLALKERYKNKNINIEIEKQSKSSKVMTKEQSIHFLDAIIEFKNGVYNKDQKGNPTTSCNLGVVNLSENVMKLGFRSSRENEKEIAINEIKNYCDDKGYKFVILGSQPGFYTEEQSSMIQQLIKSYKNTVDENGPKVVSLHITVEAGFFKDKIPGLEVAIISPKIEGAHTVNEKVSIQSIIECDNWLEDYILNFRNV